MRIKKNSEIDNYINSLLDINDLNMSLSDMFLSIIDNPDIANPKEMLVLSKKYNKSLKDVYYSKILDYWDIDEEVEDNIYILENYIYPSINELDIDSYINNPYYKNIKIKDAKIGEYELINDKYQAFELFASDDIKVDDKFVEHTNIGFFKQDISFIALNQKGVTWMSVNPNEIKTMEKAVNNSFGDVVVFGLGLGYFPYMISLKDSVKKITIVERDKTIIKIFKEHILPQFEHKNKITIIESDAFEYIKKPVKCDYVFVDLWHNAEDGLNLFIKFKRYEQEHNDIKFDYWLEDSFYALLRRAFISLLYEQKEGYSEKEYQHSKSSFDKVINRFYQQTKNLSLNSIDEIGEFLKDNKLLELYM